MENSVFIDTSAFITLTDGADPRRGRAMVVWRDLVRRASPLITNNYVILETSALVQHRWGMRALQQFTTAVVPLLTVDWIDEERHRAAVELTLMVNRRALSLVDCVSFQTMRRRGIQTVFCFDDHFREQGFDVVP